MKVSTKQLIGRLTAAAIGFAATGAVGVAVVSSQAPIVEQGAPSGSYATPIAIR